MRASSVSALISVAAIAVAQDLSGLPVCAQTAAVAAATSSGCGLTDANCLCNNSGFIASLKTTISGSCTGSDQQTACTWGNSACTPFGVSIDCNIAAAPSSSSQDATVTTPTDSSASTSPVSDSGTTSTTPSPTEAEDPATASTTMSTLTETNTDNVMPSFISMTTGTMVENGTVACTQGCGNMTHAPTIVVSKTEVPTSQYTGAASSADRNSGILGAVIGGALLLAFF